MPRILIVEDSDLMRESMHQILAGADWEVESFAGGREALDRFASENFHVVITDFKMPGMDGLDVLEEVKRIQPDVPVVMVTAFATIPGAVEAVKKGAYDYIEKPVKAEILERVVQRALNHRNLTVENEILKAQLGESASADYVWGQEGKSRELYEMVQAVARTESTVLITGESGVGKEVVARALHAMSRRKDRPFLCVNCAALSAGLLESELFGHEKGAFTGADRMRKGRFELADGGTLLLDEISEIDLGLQAKLLRVLQERTFERVGSSVVRRADVRILATSNRDLARAVAEGKFREDLYYRLNVVPVHVPPLRERRQDIPALVAHVMKKVGGRATKPLSREVMNLLTNYAWPGNIRELGNIVERIAVLSETGGITPERISSWLEGRTAQPDDALRALAGRPLEEVELKLIRLNVKLFNGNQTKAAEAMGISTRTLRDKLKKGEDFS